MALNSILPELQIPGLPSLASINIEREEFRKMLNPRYHGTG